MRLSPCPGAAGVMVVGWLQQQAWTVEDGSARSVVEVVAEELGPSLRWATATTTRITKSGGEERLGSSLSASADQ